MNEFSYEEKRKYHSTRKKQLERKINAPDYADGVKSKEEIDKDFKQLLESIGFLTGADYESCKKNQDSKRGVDRGVKSFLFDKKDNDKKKAITGIPPVVNKNNKRK